MANQSYDINTIPARQEEVKLLDEAFMHQIISSRNEKTVLTGFTSLDQILHRGLHPNLVILGGGTGAGKTSFVLQIADYIAASGRDVLFFSLEMSKWELIAKSISRISWQMDPDNALTAAEIMYDYGIWEPDPELRMNFEEAKGHYFRNIAPHFFIDEGSLFMTLEKIRISIRDHIESYSSTPVVIIDYIQLLRGSDPGTSEKQTMDEVIYGLENIRREFRTPVIGLSSLNRGAYGSKTKGTNIRTDSFKESGSIEYTAEILLGFNLDETAPAYGIRKIRLDVLKGRFMENSCCQYFDFHPAFGFFEESLPPVQKKTSSPVQKKKK